MTALEKHLWLALSAQENLVLSLASFGRDARSSTSLLRAVCARIAAACSALRGGPRTVRCLPGPSSLEVNDGSADLDGYEGAPQKYAYDNFEDLLVDVFLEEASERSDEQDEQSTTMDHSESRDTHDVNQAASSGHKRVPQVLVLPFMENYAPSVQIQIKNMIRNKKFVLKDASYLLPSGFIAVAVVGSMCDKGIRGDLIDRFGLSLSLGRADLQATQSLSLPALQSPKTPPLHYKLGIRTYASDVITAARHHSLLHNVLVTARCSASHVLNIASMTIRLRNIFDSSSPTTSETAHQQEIRPEDVREVFASCILHRLRLREPHQRLSNFWEALPPSSAPSASAGKSDLGEQDWPRTRTGNISAISASTDGPRSPQEEESIVAQILFDILNTV